MLNDAWPFHLSAVRLLSSLESRTVACTLPSVLADRSFMSQEFGDTNETKTWDVGRGAVGRQT